MIRLSLDAASIRSFKDMGRSLPEDSVRRFKSLTEGGCVPLHIQDRRWRSEVSVSKQEERLPLPPEIVERAKAIVAKENGKLSKDGVRGGWIDGEKLAVRSIDAWMGEVDIRVSVMLWSQILAMKDLPFEDIAQMGAFKLDTNTHVIGKDNGHPVLLVGQRGRKPGEKRMGSEALLAPVGKEVQWTLATNGVLDEDVRRSARSPQSAWQENSLKELSEELGVGGRLRLEYLGLMVDPRMFTGALGILGAIHTEMSPAQIDDSRKEALHRDEVPVLDVIAMEMESIAAYLRTNRDSMVPQLITGLVMLGHRTWGEDFLKKADR